MTPNMKIKALIAALFVLIGVSCSAQSMLSHLEKPKTEYNHYKMIRTDPKTTHLVADSSLPTFLTDTTWKGWRLTGLTVLYGITSGYTASNVYAGTGIGYEHDTYTAKTQRWKTDWAVGIGLYAGGHVAPGNLQAATAVGVNVALLNKFLIIGVLYNLNTPTGQTSHWVGAIGGNAYFVPTN